MATLEELEAEQAAARAEWERLRDRARAIRAGLQEADSPEELDAIAKLNGAVFGPWTRDQNLRTCGALRRTRGALL